MIRSLTTPLVMFGVLGVGVVFLFCFPKMDLSLRMILLFTSGIFSVPIAMVWYYLLPWKSEDYID